MADLNKALASNVDVEAVRQNNVRVENLSSVVREMVKSILDEVCGDLDSYMKQIDNCLINNNDKPVSVEELEDFVLNLPCLLYLVSKRKEDLKIREEVSKAIYKEVFNRVREKSQGTVADKDTAADLASQAESVTVIVYQRASSGVKERYEAALEMLASVKKVLSMRIAEIELTRQVGG